MQEARGVYLYFLAKISELLDTVFFVLRKRERQISFLHMYHHTVMPMISWGATKYYPGGHGTFIGKSYWFLFQKKSISLFLFDFIPYLGTINSFVHIVMYSYYLLSAFGPKIQKYLWWKKHITNMQMVDSLGFSFDYFTVKIWFDQNNDKSNEKKKEKKRRKIIYISASENFRSINILIRRGCRC